MDQESRSRVCSKSTSWKELNKCGCKLHGQSRLKLSTRFAQLAFDFEGRRLFVVDSKGDGFLIDLTSNFVYKQIGYVGHCNFVEFNSLDNETVVLGIATEVKLVPLINTRRFVILSGHTSIAKKASFYNDFCMTVSNKEAIVWCLKTFTKIHQLNLPNQSLSIRTGLFSNFGLMSVLFNNNTIQCWQYGEFDKQIATLALDEEFDLRNAKDLAFSSDDGMMIVGGYSKILVLDTQSWKDLTCLDVSGGLNVNKLSLMETGQSLLIALLLSDNSLQFVYLSLNDLRPPHQLKYTTYCETMKTAKKIATVPVGKRLFAHIKTDGELVISDLKQMVSEPVKKLHQHKPQQHLKKVQMAIKEELKLSRLVPILKEFGEYPERHRSLIWSTIINLPQNDVAFSAMKNKVVNRPLHPMTNYRLAERSKANLLATTVDCLTSWCSLLGYCEFVHELVFPFIVVFQRNPILAFESCLTIILNFCQKWFEYHPLPPLNILAIIENMLLEADPQLLSFFCERQITTSDYAWPLLKTTFSEVLSASDWLLLWDHLLTYRKPSLLLCCAVAFNMCCRDVIMTSLKTREDVQRFYSSQSQVQAKRMLKVAQNLDQLLPWKIHPKQYIRDELVFLPTSDVYPPLPQLEYPKMLIEDFHLESQEDVKRQKALKKEEERKAAQIAEEKRLKIETDNFRKQVEKARFNELRKCYEGLSELSNVENDATWSDCKRVESNRMLKQPSFNTSFRANRPKPGSSFCSNMEKQVKQLESDTSSLLSRSKVIYTQ